MPPKLEIVKPIRIETPEVHADLKPLKPLVQERPNLIVVPEEGAVVPGSAVDLKMKITPDLGKSERTPSTVFKLEVDPLLKKDASKPNLKKKVTTVSATVSAVIAMILGVVGVENYFRLKSLADHSHLQDPEALKTISSDENNGAIDMHSIQSQGTAMTLRGPVNIQVETLYLDYNHKAILTVTASEPMGPDNFNTGEGEFINEVTLSGVNRSEAELLHQQFLKEYQETGSAKASIEWLRKSAWGSRVDPQ